MSISALTLVAARTPSGQALIDPFQFVHPETVDKLLGEVKLQAISK